MGTTRRTLIGGAVCLLLGAAACDEPAARPAPAGPAGSFGGTDLAWIEINIAMDEELVRLLELAPTNASSALVKAYASQFRALTEGELVALRRLHDRAGLPARNPHEGMPMPGLVTPEQVAAARGTDGAAFDALLARYVRAYLEQGARLAASEEKAGVESQTTALAKRIRDNRAKALKNLVELAVGG